MGMDIDTQQQQWQFATLDWQHYEQGQGPLVVYKKLSDALAEIAFWMHTSVLMLQQMYIQVVEKCLKQ